MVFMLTNNMYHVHISARHATNLQHNNTRKDRIDKEIIKCNKRCLCQINDLNSQRLEHLESVSVMTSQHDKKT